MSTATLAFDSNWQLKVALLQGLGQAWVIARDFVIKVQNTAHRMPETAKFVVGLTVYENIPAAQPALILTSLTVFCQRWRTTNFLP